MCLSVREIAQSLVVNPCMLKIKESKEATRIANRPAWNVWVKDAPQNRGRQIMSVICHQDRAGNWIL